ncbi:MAG TPA: thioredoxin-like domain-containing protein [Gammaproteobacteria bacterium]|nr:thioredoxin-like domain-containing protein [Gammaproteobacteria bacterium]
MIRLLLMLAALAAAVPARAGEPDFPHDAPWFNVTRALTGHDLRGHVVLLDFFTPGCINCIHLLPETEKLEDEFGKRLVVIGVNSPKFKASRNSPNIRGFIERYHIRHPVVTDSGMVLWKHYGVHAWPTQILLGPDGHVVGRYLGEGHYQDIRKAVIQTLAKARKAGTLTAARLPLKPAIATHKGLLQPGKVAVDPRYVAVSDTGHNRVIVLDHSGKVLRIVGDGHRGARNGPSARARFDGPRGPAFVGGTLYVADTGNALIRAVDLKSGRVSTVAGNGRRRYGVFGSHPARDVALNSPWGLEAVGHELYIAMAGDHQIWKLDLAKSRIDPFAGDGGEGIRNGDRRRASFAQSSGLAFHDGDLYVADPEASAVRRIDLKTGEVRTLIGRGLFTFGLRDGPARKALLQHDQGIAWLRHRLYIADTFNNAIRVLDPETHKVSTLTKGLAQPGGLAVLDPHTLLVADTNADRMVAVDAHSGAAAPAMAGPSPVCG